MKSINFIIEKKIAGALGRVGKLETPHGTILTPSFVVVGTKATVKALSPEQVKDAGAQVVLANTYHLYLQPGDELIRDAGGLHKFMNWNGPTMTDSGGFQVFSLGVAYGKELSKVVSITDPSLLIPERSSIEDGVPRLATIGNDGVSFRSHIDGSLHYITPEKSIEIQHNLGADIIFAFDECTSPTENERYQEEALSRTHAWAKRSLEKHLELEEARQKSQNSSRLTLKGSDTDKNFDFSASLPQALFGIVQGGRSEKLRKKSAEVIGGMDFDGFGIGGSFAKEDMSTAVKWVNEILPEEKPRHLLGIGEPEDLFMGVENGVDLFDCVGPTRIARNGTLFTKNGKINITNAKFVNDFNPIDEGCNCYTCSNYTKSYLAHLFRAKEMLGATLASIHNVYFINKLVSDMRQAILEDKFFEFKKEFLAGYLK
ncbi:MAG: tRNA guanosine(34) transglycosylase Tgt [Candidatus Paceibacterota bacterium]